MMERNKRNIDEFFQEELGGLTEMPPSSVWDTLEKRLDDNKPKSKKIAWWLLPLIAIVFIGGSIAAYVAMNHNTTASNTAPSISANDFTKINSTKPQSNTTIDHSSNTPLTEENESAKNEIKSPATDNKQSNRNKENNIATNNNPTKNAPDQSNESAALNESKPKTGSSLEKVLNNQDVAAAPSNKERLKKSLDNNTQQKSKDNQLANTSNNANNPATAKENIAPESAKSNSVKTKKESLQEEASNAALANKVVPNANSQTASKTSKAKGSAKGALNSSPATTEKASNATASSATATKEELNSSAQTAQKRLEANAAKEESQSKANATAQKPSASNAVIADKAVQDPKKTTNTNNNSTPLAAQADQKDRKDKASNQASAVQKPLAKTSQNQTAAPKEEKPQNKNQIQANTTEPQKTNQAEQEDTAEEDEGTSESGGGVAAATKKPKQKRPLNMLLGIKAGYERGLDNYTATKYVGNLFAEVTFSRKISFLFQPGIKLTQTNQDYTIGSTGYFKVNSNGVNRYNVRKDTLGKPIGYDYAYTQSYDSIIALQQAKRSYMEIELPFLFRFKFDQHFSVLGGMNFTFGKILDFTSNLKTIAGLNLYDTLLNSRDSIAPSAPAKFSHPGSTPFSSYKEDNAAAISPIRFGYIFGISYQIKERLMLDLLVQQNLSKLNSIQDDGIRKLYTQPYVRFSIGYNLFGVKKK